MNHGEKTRPESSESSFSVVQSSSRPDYASSITASEQKSGEPSNQNPSTSENTGTTNFTTETGRVCIIKELKENIESFRSSGISKMTVIASSHMNYREKSDVSLSETQKEMTFNSYLTEILAIQFSKDNLGENQEIGESTIPSTLDAKKGDTCLCRSG